MRLVPLILLCLAGLGGCIGDADPGSNEAPPGPPGPAGATPTGPPIPEPEQPPAPAAGRPAPVEASWENGTLTAKVEVPVVLIGFPAGTASRLAATLDLPQLDFTYLRDLHGTDVERGRILFGGYLQVAQPLQPRPAPVVYEVPSEAATRYFAGVPVVDGRHDGNAAESAAATMLAGFGIPFGRHAPALVLMYHPDALPYRYAYENGHLESARVFGGHEPLVLMDLAVPTDAYAGDDKDYQRRIDPNDVEALAAATDAAMRFRLLHGFIYAPPLADCHAVTVLHAVRVTGETGLFSTVRSDEVVDAPRLAAQFERLTGEPTFVDVLTVHLPVEDPALDALFRAISTSMLAIGVGATQAIDTLRAWVEANWDTYHVAHDGCEGYLSLLLFGDAADVGPFGLAMHDVAHGHRVSISMVSEASRSAAEGGPLGGFLYGQRGDSFGEFDWGNHLLAHETGHLFGLAHPHNALMSGGTSTEWTFSPVLTPMSYQVADRTIDFGEIDATNWARNRVGFLLEAVIEAEGIEAVPEAVWAAIEGAQWAEANRMLQQRLL